MSEKIIVPGIGVVDPSGGVTPDAEAIVAALGMLSQQLNVLSLQLDLLLRMESGQTPRSEVRSRIIGADVLAQQQRESQNGDGAKG